MKSFKSNPTFRPQTAVSKKPLANSSVFSQWDYKPPELHSLFQKTLDEIKKTCFKEFSYDMENKR